MEKSLYSDTKWCFDHSSLTAKYNVQLEGDLRTIVVPQSLVSSPGFVSSHPYDNNGIHNSCCRHYQMKWINGPTSWLLKIWNVFSKSSQYFSCLELSCVPCKTTFWTNVAVWPFSLLGECRASFRRSSQHDGSNPVKQGIISSWKKGKATHVYLESSAALMRSVPPAEQVLQQLGAGWSRLRNRLTA